MFVFRRKKKGNKAKYLGLAVRHVRSSSENTASCSFPFSHRFLKWFQTFRSVLKPVCCLLPQVRAHQLVLPPCEVVIKAVAEYVSSIKDLGNLDAIARDVFKQSQVRRCPLNSFCDYYSAFFTILSCAALLLVLVYIFKPKA